MNNITHSQFLERKNLNTNELNNLQLISKKISQLIAKSWLSNDEDGKRIREVLLLPNTPDKTGKIKKLLEDHGINIENLGVAKIEVDWDSFFGSLKDTGDPQSPLTLVIAYPPRPTEFNITEEALETWVSDTDDSRLIPDHPYIPVTW